MRNIENPFIPPSEKKSTSFFAMKNKPKPKIPQASTETLVDLEDRFVVKEYLGVRMNQETLTFFKALAEQIGEDGVKQTLERQDTEIIEAGELTQYNCISTDIVVLPKLPKTLVALACANTKIKELPELPKGLRELYCQNTDITDLPELPTGLIVLNCSYCLKLTLLPKLSAGLKELNCSNTPFANDKKQLKELKALYPMVYIVP